MRRDCIFFTISLVLVVLFLTAGTAIARDRARMNIDSVRQRITTLRNWQLMDEFNLSPERAQRVFDILSSFDQKRIELIQKRRRIINQLRNGVEGEMDDARLDELMRQLSEVNIAIARLPEEERKALSEVFTPKEQAKYILFSMRFARDIARAMKMRTPPARRPSFR